MRFKVAPLPTISIAALVLMNIWFAVIGTQAIMMDGDVSVGKVDWRPSVSTPSDDDGPSKPITAYLQTLASPIFFKSRARFVPAPPPAPPPIKTPPSAPHVLADPGLALSGVMITGGIRKAYVVRKTDPMGVWVTQGEDIAGWTMQSIDSGGAVINKDNRAIQLQLYPDK